MSEIFWPGFYSKAFFLFSQSSSTTDVRLGSKYASGYTQVSPIEIIFILDISAVKYIFSGKRMKWSSSKWIKGNFISLYLFYKVSYKVVLSLLMGVIKHSECTQSNMFAISLQYLKKDVRNGVHFLHTDEHQNFYKLALSFLMEVTRNVQSTQIKLVIFLQYIEKKVLQLLKCSIVMQNAQNFTGVQSCFFSLRLGGSSQKWVRPSRSWK